ncbi:MAG TPA: tRNA preQ1(34) S-adenosylmethionine ribosyltransferase-isomerase QueA [Elusimicrobiota bacterium]|nr:tRNA preQ1(34) S-adenosylmethionine ribosyltransferase-isomerase QueA [Elusimicrobiota bacterium]
MMGFPEIPDGLIAQRPDPVRDRARLMVLDRGARTVKHAHFYQLEGYFRPGDVLVLNDTRVMPARLSARKETGGKVRLLLLKEVRPRRWRSLLTPSLKLGTRLLLEEGCSAVVDGRGTDGEYEIEFSCDVSDYMGKHGRMPLPPYIERADGTDEAADRESYQTVYARQSGAVAAPTAGLHFTEALLDRVRQRGVEVVSITLTVGWGTFRPVKGEDYRDHRMLPEDVSVGRAAVDQIRRCRETGGRVWAAGTTTVRALESASGQTGEIREMNGPTELYVYPGYRFRSVDVMLTNFHLPGHTPLLMTAAFAGEDFLRNAYREAIEAGYRFFSYGDAMLIL